MRISTGWTRSRLRRLNEMLVKTTGIRVSLTPAAGDRADPETRARIARAREASMTSAARLYALDRAVAYVVRAAIPGAIVECGVWRGGSMQLAAEALIAHGGSDRALHLYDTFDGMTSPSDVDEDPRGRSAGVLVARSGDTSRIRARAALDEVKRNLAATGYPEERIHYVVGRVEETLPARAPESIALLRLDTDWYASTRHELVHLFPRLAPGGVLIVDDYGHWKGCRKAVDEYFAESPMLLSFVDDTGVIGVKR